MSLVKEVGKGVVKHFKSNQSFSFALLGLLLLLLLLLTGVLDPVGNLGNIVQPNGNTYTRNMYIHPHNKYDKPQNILQPDVDYRVQVIASEGTFIIDVFEDDVPINANNFLFLVKEGFYNGLKFHFINPNVSIQGGDPDGDGLGGPGYVVKDEIDADALGLDNLRVGEVSFLQNEYSLSLINKYKNMSVKQFYEEVDGYSYTSGFGTHRFGPYTVAMANAGPNTNGSQFFITGGSGNFRAFDGKFTVIGVVISGQDVIDKMIQKPVNGNGVPTKPIVIKSMRILR